MPAGERQADHTVAGEPLVGTGPKNGVPLHFERRITWVLEGDHAEMIDLTARSRHEASAPSFAINSLRIAPSASR